MNSLIKKDNLINDQIILSKVKDSLIKVNSLLNFSNLNDRDKATLLSIREDLEILENYSCSPSFNYLQMKSLLNQDYNGKLELDGTAFLIPFVDEPCPSRIITHHLNILCNG